MKTKIILSIASMTALLLSWRFFDLFLSNDKVDLFLFYDLSQKPHWYVFYTSQYLQLIIGAHLIHSLVSTHYKELKTLTVFFVIFTWLRLASYWLFRGSINIEVMVACVIMYCIFELSIRWHK